MLPPGREPVVFISYSHRDRGIKDRLVKHISVLGPTSFELWDDTSIRTGDDWRGRIGDALARADAAILLISADFLTSSFIKETELPALLARPTYPILIGYCAWQKVPWLEKLQMRTDDGKPLGTRGRKLDRVLVEVAVEMTDLYGAATGAPAPAPEPAFEHDVTSAVEIDPADPYVAIVLQKDVRTGPVFNMLCRLRNASDDPAMLQRLEIVLTDPHGASITLAWNLFYEGAMVHRRIGDAQPLALPPRCDRQIGIQFVGPPSIAHYRWPQGHYRFVMNGWLTGSRGTPADVVTRREIAVRPWDARNLTYWAAAGPDQWKALDDPDNAVGIPVEIFKRSPAAG